MATYNDFKDFYINSVIPLKQANPSYIRLDGQIGPGTQAAFGFFHHNGTKWKVDSDTEIEKLDVAFKIFDQGHDPFIVKETKKGQCLIIKDEPQPAKKFYVYRA